MKKLLSLILMVSISFFIVNCGGGGGDSSPTTSSGSEGGSGSSSGSSSESSSGSSSEGGSGTETLNKAPTANAGADITAIVGEDITLDGNKSSDSDGDIVSYEWLNESNNSLSDKAKFTTHSLTEGVHIITLKVTDDDGAEATDEVKVTINPKPVVTNNPPEIESKNIGTPMNMGPMKLAIAQPNQAFTFTFNEDDLDESTIDENSFVLLRMVGEAGSSIAGKYEKIPYTKSLSGNTLTITPTKALPQGWYQFAMNKKVKDTSGQELVGTSLYHTGDYMFHVGEPMTPPSFSIEKIGDKYGNSSDVGTTSDINVTFSKAVDVSSLDSITMTTTLKTPSRIYKTVFGVTNIPTQKLTFTYTLFDDNKTIEINPDERLSSDMEYMFDMRKVKDTDGNLLEQVSGIDAYSGSYDVKSFDYDDVGKQYVLEFDSNVKEDTVKKENITFCAGVEALQYVNNIIENCTTEYTVEQDSTDKKKINIKPASKLEKYTYVIVAYKNIKNSIGEAAPNDFSWSLYPWDAELTQFDNEQIREGVGPDTKYTGMLLEFEKPYDKTTMKASNILFYEQDLVDMKFKPTDVEFDIKLSSDDKNVTITPKRDGVYTYILTENVKDANGNKIKIKPTNEKLMYKGGMETIMSAMSLGF